MANAELIEQIGKAVHELRAVNDRALKDVGGRVDKVSAEATAEMAKLNARLDELEKERDAGVAASNRPVPGGSPERPGERDAFFACFRNPANVQKYQAGYTTEQDTSGGWLLPETIERDLTADLALTPMRQACFVRTDKNTRYKLIQRHGAMQVVWIGEDPAVDPRGKTTMPSLKEVTPYWGQMQAKPSATSTFLEDMDSDIESWFLDEVRDAFVQEENTVATTGNGAKKPRGLFVWDMSTTADASRAFNTYQVVHSGSSGAIVADKLIDVVHAMDARYLPGAQWMASRLTQGAMRKLKQGDIYIWQPSFVPGQPSTLLGYPIVSNDAVPAIAADAVVAAFGDFKKGFVIHDIPKVNTLRNPYSTDGEVVFPTTKRFGTRAWKTNAIKFYKLST